MAEVQGNGVGDAQQPGGGPAQQRQQVLREPLITIQDRLFHTLFFRVTLFYAQACPRPIRRIIETIILIKAIFCFLMLIYIHMVFARNPVHCLENVKDSWPRDGILRVEVIRNFVEDPSNPYTVEKSYEKERQILLRSREQDELSLLFASFSGDGIVDDLFSTSEDYDDHYSHSEASFDKVDYYYHEDREEMSETTKTSQVRNLTLSENSTSSSSVILDENLLNVTHSNQSQDIAKNGFESANSSEEVNHTLPSDHHVEQGSKIVLHYSSSADDYIVEYSLEYGFLRLSPETRQKLNVSVLLVVLDPAKNSCFGDTLSQFILNDFLGYDDVLMSSIKSLAESEHSKGYLRNVVTGAHYHFVKRWTSMSSYLVAITVMAIFTVSISMLLRYSQHQIFMFIVELLQMLEFNTPIVFPITPLLTVILALVGMEAIMSEFFEDTTTAFYVILIVWIADQYDAICCHTNITKKYWLRFFYLYHFSFYAYHYRFNGQYSGLSLLTMWLFTQHSMVYFFHHYELPVILQQAEIQNLLRNQGEMRVGNAGGGGGGVGGGGARLGNQARLGANQQQQQAQRMDGMNVQGNVRQRMRTFNLGGIRFRFGVVFHRNAVNEPVQRRPVANPQQQEDPVAPQEEQPQPPLPEAVEPISPSDQVVEASTDAQSTINSDLNESVESDDGVAHRSDNLNQDDADSGDLTDIRDELYQHSEELREMQNELSDLSRTLRGYQENDASQ